MESNIGKVDGTDEKVKSMYDQYKKQAESQKQKPEEFEAVKPQLVEQVVSQKKNEKVSGLIQELRKNNGKNIDVRL